MDGPLRGPIGAAEPDLVLLRTPAFRGVPIPSGRAMTLVAALVAAGGAGMSAGTLVNEVWPDDPPAHPDKALKVVSRLRSATEPDLVLRTAGGYRLGDVTADVHLLAQAASAAERAERRGDLAALAEAAAAADALAAGLARGPAAGLEPGRRAPATSHDVPDGPLAGLRRAAERDVARVERARALAASAAGDHQGAYPLLVSRHDADPGDETVLAALLRSEARARGVGAALARYETHRRRVAAHLGADPGPELRRVYTELLAADRPIRTGLRAAATPLVGREEDVRRVLAAIEIRRVLSIVGPGGLGKTVLAQAVAHAVDAPVVHVVGLVSVRDDDEVLDAVAAALGVRDSVAGRRRRTGSVRDDLRAQLAAPRPAPPRDQPCAAGDRGRAGLPVAAVGRRGCRGAVHAAGASSASRGRHRRGRGGRGRGPARRSAARD